jgi:hypothetical protein
LTSGRKDFTHTTAKKFDKQPSERGLSSNGVVNLVLKKSKLPINKPSKHTRAIHFLYHSDYPLLSCPSQEQTLGGNRIRN